MSRLLNAFQMIDILSVRSVVSVQELSRTLEISERGVQRLRDDLLTAGFDIESIFGPNGGYRLLSKSKISPREFTGEEMELIQKSLGHLVQSGTNIFEEGFVETIGKLANHIDYYGFKEITSVQSVKLNVEQAVYQKNITQIDQAITKRERILINYSPTPFDQRNYTFEPYELLVMNQFWYLLGYDEKQRFLTLKVNRIIEITPLNSIFRKDELTQTREKISQFGYKLSPVKLVANITNRTDISEYIWGKDQEIHWKSAKEFDISVEFSNLKAAESFVMQIASNISILSPISLKEWMIQEANKIISMNG